MTKPLAEVLAEARRVLDSHRRTVLCPPDMLERCQEVVRQNGMEDLITVKASPYVDERQILIVDEQSLEVSMVPRGPAPWFSLDSI